MAAGLHMVPYYAKEATTCREWARELNGKRLFGRAAQFQELAERYESVIRRLQWSPTALQQMKDAA